MDQRVYEDVLNNAIHKYGDMSQMRQCIEEMAELTQAISKFQRAKNEEEQQKALNNLAEEIADVHIMTDQLALIVSGYLPKGEKNKVNEVLEYKIMRLRERIENE